MSQQPNLTIFDSSSPSPALFDGTTRLYICVKCPYAQRVWIGRNYKGLDRIELVAINLEDKPKWYLEKVYPPGKVPSLEHNGKVIGESLDLLEYFDQNFEGPLLFPKDTAKESSRKELWTFTGQFTTSFSKTFKDKGADKAYVQENLGPLLDNLEASLSKFDHEGPFFLGEISAVDFAYAPFIQRYELGCFHFFDYNIFEGRPKLSNWFQAINAVDAYKYTKHDPKVILHRLRTLAGRL